MEITKKTIYDNVEDRNANNLGVTAFESMGGNSINYKTFFELVNIYAKAFKEIGVKNGDIVTICSAGTLDTILNFAALNKIGAVSQFVNPNYFKYNSKKYINDANSKLLICLDRFYPLIKDAISNTNVEQIILSSISEYSSFLYKVIARRKKISKNDMIDDIKYIELPDFIKLGEKSNVAIEKLQYESDKPAVITYTSGTTGNPKGVVHTNDSINNMINIYAETNGFGLAGDCRNLVLIPPMYLTSLIHSIITPMSLGTTNILQPIYNPKTFGRDLKNAEPKLVVASKAHYINLEDSKLLKGSLSFTKNAYCGGEAISKSTALRINRILDYYGIPPMIIGYGQTEFGTMTMFSNDVPNRTNESGVLIPHVKAKIVDPQSSKPVEKGQRGELYIQTPAIMKGYFQDEDSTSKFIVIDENGEKWGKTGDIAEVLYQYNGQDVYGVLGRKNDSFIDENGNIVYLFDIEAIVEDNKYVREAEVVAMNVDGKQVPVVHVVLEKGADKLSKEVLTLINKKITDAVSNPSAIPYAYKVRNSFETSPISGKRDYASLVYETDGFVRFDKNGELHPIDINISEEKHNILLSKIFIKK